MRAVRQGDTIRIYDSYLYRESIKEIDGRFCDADEKCWIIPLNSKNVATLGLLGATLDKELTEMAKTERGAFVSVCTHPTPRVKAKLFRHQQDERFRTRNIQARQGGRFACGYGNGQVDDDDSNHGNA